MAALAINGRTNGGTKNARRTMAAVLIALSFAAMLVHGRAGRPVQPQFAKVTEATEAFERPSHS